MTQELLVALAGAEEPSARAQTYLIYRQRVVEEDALIDNRMSWFLAAQPTFLAGFVLLFPIASSVAGVLFLLFLSVVGLAVTFISRRSVKAAKDEIEALVRDYEAVSAKLPGHDADTYPALIGRAARHANGHTLPTFLPLLFYFLWGALAVGALCVYVGWLELGPDGVTLVTHL